MAAAVVSLPTYEKRVSRILRPQERAQMECFIALDPERHPVMSGTGGFRKARWGRQGKGKSGGVRTIYYFAPSPDIVYMADIYPKNERRPSPMPTRKPSSASRKNSKTSKAKHSAAGRRLIGAAKEMLAHARGEISLPMRIYHAPGKIDVKAIRERTGLSQAGFARRYALSARALQEWEQGRRTPDPAVRAYLTVIRHDPDAVVRALEAESSSAAPSTALSE